MTVKRADEVLTESQGNGTWGMICKTINSLHTAADIAEAQEKKMGELVSRLCVAEGRLRRIEAAIDGYEEEHESTGWFSRLAAVRETLPWDDDNSNKSWYYPKAVALGKETGD